MSVVTWLTAADLDSYLHLLRDPLQRYILGDRRAAGLTSERWLVESEARRMVAWTLYWPILYGPRRSLIFDIGSGFSSLSFAVGRHSDYLAVDLCAHDKRPASLAVFEGDWASLPDLTPDLVVSMDLFPNVDQRLDAFLTRFAGMPMRLILTTYDDRWYRAKRTDADELLTVAAWSWWQLATVLGAHGFDCPPPPPDDLFGNGRQVCLLVS